MTNDNGGLDPEQLATILKTLNKTDLFEYREDIRDAIVADIRWMQRGLDYYPRP